MFIYLNDDLFTRNERKMNLQYRNTLVAFSTGNVHFHLVFFASLNILCQSTKFSMISFEFAAFIVKLRYEWKRNLNTDTSYWTTIFQSSPHLSLFCKSLKTSYKNNKRMETYVRTVQFFKNTPTFFSV